jgi:hypothetical protein
MWLASSIEGFLLEAGKLLEALNSTIADELPRHSAQGNMLDAQLIAAEQSALERLLHSLQVADAAAHAVTTSQLDRVLDPDACSAGFAARSRRTRISRNQGRVMGPRPGPRSPRKQPEERGRRHPAQGASRVLGHFRLR